MLTYDRLPAPYSDKPIGTPRYVNSSAQQVHQQTVVPVAVRPALVLRITPTGRKPTRW